MPDKIFQEISTIEIKRMIAESESLSQIDHPYLKGKIREIGIGKLLKRFLPPEFKIGTGKIHDCHGKSSSETDLIIFNPSFLPPLMFNEEIGIYPLESAFYSIEIKSKSTTTKESLKKTILNIRRLRELTFLNNYGNHPIKTYPVSAFFSYGSNNNIDVLKILKDNDDKFNSAPLLNPICIVGKGYWFFSKWKGKSEWIKILPNDDYYEVSGFIGGIVNTLIGNNHPLYGYYILDPLEDTLHEIYSV